MFETVFMGVEAHPVAAVAGPQLLFGDPSGNEQLDQRLTDVCEGAWELPSYGATSQAGGRAHPDLLKRRIASFRPGILGLSTFVIHPSEFNTVNIPAGS
ncbi:MAG TPA: hypothetical protein VGL68_02095 [Solirubrobacteraceae bacterium]